MKKTFVTNLVLIIALNLLIKPFWVLGIDLGVQNAVGAKEYGLYFSLFNLSLVLNILLDFGVTNFNNRNIAQHSFLLNKYFANIITLKFILGIFYSIICLAIGFILGYTPEQFNILYLLILNQFLLSFILYLRSNISGLHLFKTDSLLSVLDRLLMIIICGILLWGKVIDKPFQIEWFVYTQTSAYIFTALLAFLVVLKKSKRIKVKFDYLFFIAVLKQSYPYAILILMMSFYNRFDSVMIERLLPDGKEQAGIYAQAFRLLDSASMIAFLFAGLLLPIFSRMIKNKESVNQLLKLSYLLLAVPASIIVIASIFYSKELISLLYHEHLEYASSVFSILICSFIPVSTTYIFGSLLTANGDLKRLNWMASLGMFLNIILNLILIPRFQALGSAYSSLFTQLFTAVAQFLIAKRIFKFTVSIKYTIEILVFLLGLIGLAWIIHTFIPYWYVGILLFCSLGLGFSFLLNILNIKMIIQIFRSEEN